VGLVKITCEGENVTRFTDVNIVTEATGIVAATSGIQEGTTDTDHGELDGEQKVWRRLGWNLYPAPRGPTLTNNA
jgi:hypothetical protein